MHSVVRVGVRMDGRKGCPIFGQCGDCDCLPESRGHPTWKTHIIGGTMSTTRGRICVLFDLNGTLVHRTAGRKREVGAAYPPSGTDSGKRKVYVRPGGAELVAELVHDDRVDVGIYTSTMLKNATKMTACVVRAFETPIPSVLEGGEGVPEWVEDVRARVGKGPAVVSWEEWKDSSSSFDQTDDLLAPGDSFHGDDIAPGDDGEEGEGKGKGKGRVFVLDRTFNKRDPEGEERWDTMRDLESVWEQVLEPAGYGPESTIVVDNEVRKVREVEDNALVVASFEAEGVAGETQVEGYATMSALRTYLYDLLDEMEDDVRPVISSSPFDSAIVDWVSRTPNPSD